ncbi:HAD family hydrolase [Desulfotomaculum varum]
MLKTILFDLDGTLLPMDLSTFLTNYFDGLARICSHVAEPKVLHKHIMAATAAMIRDTRPHKTNQEVFLEDFTPRFNLPAEELMALFDNYYQGDFKNLIHCTAPTPLSRQICLLLLDKGYRLVLATNPIFPSVATAQRMQWAGIDDLPWALVTTYEHCHYCKPNPEYYREVLEKVGAKPSETLMVGNDTKEDLAAAKLGIKTYLVTDYLITHGDADYRADFTGRLEDFMEFAKKLPRVIS